MKKTIQLFHLITLFFLLFSACEKTEIGMEEKVENEMEEITTRAGANNRVYSIEGDMNPFVGTRQAYTVRLDHAVSEPTRVAIRASSDAVLIAYGSTYAREYTITVPIYTTIFTFYTLITKAQSKISLHVSSRSGDLFSNSNNPTYVSTQNPTITIDGPSKVLPDEIFEISTNHTEVPNLQKGYEFSYSFGKVLEQYKSGSKIIMTLRSPVKTGRYDLRVSVYGGYNMKGYGGKFLIGEATFPILVGSLPRINEKEPPCRPKINPHIVKPGITLP